MKSDRLLMLLAGVVLASQLRAAWPEPADGLEIRAVTTVADEFPEVGRALGEYSEGTESAGSPAQTFGDPISYCRAVGTIDKPDSRYTGPKLPAWMAAKLNLTHNQGRMME